MPYIKVELEDPHQSNVSVRVDKETSDKIVDILTEYINRFRYSKSK